MASDASRKELVRAFIRRVWNDGDVDAAGEFLAPAYTIHHDPGDPWEGMTLDLAGFKDRLAKSRIAFPDQRFDIQSMFADADGVAMFWLWTGTHLADLPGFAATGKTICMSGMTIYGFDAEARMSGHWQVVDRMSLYQQFSQNAAAD
jgi:steroid delta-isomerase-like uncharacterized protein